MPTVANREISTTHKLNLDTFSDFHISTYFITEAVQIGQLASLKYIITNYGNTDSFQLSDLILPYFSNISVEANKTSEPEGTEYTYDTDTGFFLVPDTSMQLSPAIFSIGSMGETVITPDTFDITISGIVTDTHAPYPYIQLVPAYTDGQERHLTVTKVNSTTYTITSSGNIVPKYVLAAYPNATVTAIATPGFA